MQLPDQPPAGDPNPNPSPPPSTPGLGVPDPAAPPAGAAPTSDDRMLAMFTHFGGFLTAFIMPLIVWLIRKDQPGFVEDQSKEALNFQITVTIAYIAWFVLAAVPLLGCLIMPAIVVIIIASLVLSIVAGVKANEGNRYRYPISLRFIN